MSSYFAMTVFKTTVCALTGSIDTAMPLLDGGLRDIQRLQSDKFDFN